MRSGPMAAPPSNRVAWPVMRLADPSRLVRRYVAAGIHWWLVAAVEAETTPAAAKAPGRRRSAQTGRVSLAESEARDRVGTPATPSLRAVLNCPPAGLTSSVEGLYTSSMVQLQAGESVTRVAVGIRSRTWRK